MGRLRRPAAGRRPALAAAAVFGMVSLLGLWMGSIVAVPLWAVATGLIVPGLVMTGFWIAIHTRIAAARQELGETDVDRIRAHFLGEVLGTVAHELPVHPEPCRLRDECLAVVEPYAAIGKEMRVVVPDLTVTADPCLLRLGLHLLVDNAVRHGGRRVAIWGVADEDTVTVTVSDDGEGLSADSEDQVSRTFLDLDEWNRAAGRGHSGLNLARAAISASGGEMTYRRDPTWTHFGIRLPSPRGAVPAASFDPTRLAVS